MEEAADSAVPEDSRGLVEDRVAPEGLVAPAEDPAKAVAAEPNVALHRRMRCPGR